LKIQISNRRLPQEPHHTAHHTTHHTILIEDSKFKSTTALNNQHRKLEAGTLGQRLNSLEGVVGNPILQRVL
jgi:hypothetical protein